MQKNFEIEQGVPEICPGGQVSPGGKCCRGQVSGGQMSRSPLEGLAPVTPLTPHVCCRCHTCP